MPRRPRPRRQHLLLVSPSAATTGPVAASSRRPAGAGSFARSTLPLGCVGSASRTSRVGGNHVGGQPLAQRPPAGPRAALGVGELPDDVGGEVAEPASPPAPGSSAATALSTSGSLSNTLSISPRSTRWPRTFTSASARPGTRSRRRGSSGRGHRCGTAARPAPGWVRTGPPSSPGGRHTRSRPPGRRWDLADLARAHGSRRRVLGVEQDDAVRRERPSDGHGLPGGEFAPGRGDRGLGRPVGVEHPPPRAAPALHEAGRTGLAADEDGANPGRSRGTVASSVGTQYRTLTCSRSRWSARSAPSRR